jgi:hypothetical protein
MPVYRYRFDFINAAKLARAVSGSPSLTAASPGYVDITVGSGSKTDLDEVMAAAGYAFVSTDPNDTPTAALSTAVGSGGFDQRDVLIWDHFITAALTTERIGTMGWTSLITGTGSDLVITGEAGHPGILDFGAGTAAAGRAALYLGDSANPNFLLDASQNQLDIEFLIRVNAAALSATNMERFCLGFGNNWGAGAGVFNTNCVCAQFDPAVNANWRLMSANGGVETLTTSSGSNPEAATWYRVGIRMTYPGGTPTANLVINGTVVATHTTNIPASPVGPGIRMDANAGTEPRYQLDYVRCTQVTNKET